jgi:hypothetical protein
MKTRHLLPLAVLAAILSSCGKTESAASGSPAAGVIPETLIVSAIEGAAVTPTAAKTSAKAGDQIVLTGHIAGRAKPFVEGRAIFTLVDTKLPMCGEE